MASRSEAPSTQEPNRGSMSRDDALIHLRVPSSVKARWVERSRAAGVKLSDWVVERVEAFHATADEDAGMAWWNDLREPMRAQWLKKVEAAGGTAAAAWAAFKRDGNL